MPNYQISGIQQSGTILQGNFKIEVAGSVGVLSSSAVNLGLGRVTNISENWGKYGVQAGNGPSPLEGVSNQDVLIEFELLEFYLPSFDDLRGNNLDTENEATAATYLTGTVNTFSTGGKTELSYRALQLTNYKLVSGATVETIIIFYRGTLEQGLQFTPKDDDGDDPVTVFPFSFKAVCDAGRAAGDQLFIIETEMGA